MERCPRSGARGEPVVRSAYGVMLVAPSDFLDRVERRPRSGARGEPAARSVYGVILGLAPRAVDEEATEALQARTRGENMDMGAVRNRRFEHVEEAAADRRILRPAWEESRSTSGRER